MDRRKVLKLGIGAGVTFVADQVLGPDPAEAGKGPAASFHVGSFSGMSTSGRVLFSKRGNRLQGFMHEFQFPIVDAWRAAGRVRGSSGGGDLFDVSDVNQQTPIGDFSGTLSDGTFSGTWRMDTGPTGSFGASPIMPQLDIMRDLAGTYQGTAEDGLGNTLFTGRAKIGANGTYSISKIEGSGRVPKKLSGAYIVTEFESALVAPTFVPFPDDAFCSEEEVLCCIPAGEGSFLVFTTERIVVEHIYTGYVGEINF